MTREQWAALARLAQKYGPIIAMGKADDLKHDDGTPVKGWYWVTLPDPMWFDYDEDARRGFYITPAGRVHA